MIIESSQEYLLKHTEPENWHEVYSLTCTTEPAPVGADLDMNGWIKLFRSIRDWEWYGDPNVKSVFLHCLIMANTDTKSWRGETIERGSFITSLGAMSSELGISVKAIRIALDKLNKGKEIVSNGASKFTKITVCKYVCYQTILNTEGQAKGIQEGKQRAITEEEKKKEEKNKEIDKDLFGKKISKKVKTQKIPTLEQVVKYFEENGYSKEAAEKAFKYYEAADWHDYQGNPVLAWKQKMITVWFKPENVKPASYKPNCQL